MKKINITITGALGRMGKSLIKNLKTKKIFKLQSLTDLKIGRIINKVRVEKNSLDAFKKTEQFKANKSIAGLSPIQRYFLGYALGWMGYPTEQSLKSQLMTDVHSPAKYRVNGPFVNVKEFYSAFDIQPKDKIYRADSVRVNIW